MGTVLPTFFLIGVAFIPVGIGLLISSFQVIHPCRRISCILIHFLFIFQVREYEVDYTSCVRYDNAANNQSMLCSEYIARSENHNETCRCKINFTLETDFKRDVFLYYGLTNFYQNHRRYVKSRNDRQLLGQLRTGSDCEPYAYRVDPVDGQRKIIMPCGAIANSIFNDTFTLHFIPKEMKESQLLVPLIDTGIAWATDKKNKFRNPPIPEGATKLDSAFNNTMQPFNWRKPIYELDPLDINNNGLQNEGLIVWMRAAAFPTFRKLYARVAHDKQERGVDYQDSLPKGDYVLTIEYSKLRQTCFLWPMLTILVFPRLSRGRIQRSKAIFNLKHIMARRSKSLHRRRLHLCGRGGADPLGHLSTHTSKVCPQVRC